MLFLCTPHGQGSAPDEQVSESSNIHAGARVLLAGSHQRVAGQDGGQQQERGRQAIDKDAQRQPQRQAGHVTRCG